jgi:hypothetical protein
VRTLLTVPAKSAAVSWAFNPDGRHPRNNQAERGLTRYERTYSILAGKEKASDLANSQN